MTLRDKWIVKKIDKGMGKEKAKVVTEQVDLKTFFGTAKLILENNELPKFKDLPYVLVINDKDLTIDASHVEEVFKENVNDLLIVKTSVEHYPHNLSKEYFQKKLPAKNIREVNAFIDTPSQ